MMNRSEKSVITVEPNLIIMDSIEYIMENLTDFEMPTRIEDVFTASELRCGPEHGNAFTFMDLSQNNNGNNMNAMEVAATSSKDGNESNIPTFEINDSDEDVIFVAEYNNNCEQNFTKKASCLVPYPCFISRRTGTSTSSSSSDASSRMIEPNEPRRNPTRNARNKKYRKKSSEYITEEDLNLLMASDEESSTVDTVDETSPDVKGTRHKKVVVNNWPAEGLYERPEYNEQTEEIEKFDYSIRQIQNNAKKIGTEKPKKLKTQKKKFAVKKFNFRKNKNKSITDKKEVEMASFAEISELINETSNYLSFTFMETLIDSRRSCFHTCHDLRMNENIESVLDFRREVGEDLHSRCLSNYYELWLNQSQLFSLGNEEVDFNQIHDELKNKLSFTQN